MNCKIVFIGAGNLATHLSLALNNSGLDIIQVYSRTENSARVLAEKLNAGFTTTAGEIRRDADIYFVALKDDVYDEVLPFVDFGDKLIVHCSGSMPLSVLNKYAFNTGVFYPLQTFSKHKPVEIRTIPVFVEGISESVEHELIEIARIISDNVFVLNSEKRLFLHIAAVFSCNFVNHLYTIGSNILTSQGVPFEFLRPLILETANKAQHMEPEKAQTGPAVRYDKNVIKRHLEALRDFPDQQELYNMLSDRIFHYYNKNKDDGITEQFKKIEAFIFDVDGVLSEEVSVLDKKGDPARTANLKDGFAIRNAIKNGYPVAIITGGYQQRVKKRYEKLGVKYYYDNVTDKKQCLTDFITKTRVGKEYILYMGDDLPDYTVMLEVGMPVAPADASEEIKNISKYISPKKGGKGCVRDVIEKTMKIQGRWQLPALNSINSV